MSKAPDTMRVETTIATHDKTDMIKLGTFMLALSRADLDKLGVNGSAQIKYNKGDYIAVFDGNNVLRRATPLGAILFREICCSECHERSLSATFTTATRGMCSRCITAILCEEDAA